MVGSESTTDPRLRGMKKEEVVTPPPGASDETRKTATVEAESADDLPDDFKNRRLCPDGACIGVVGDDGVCGECGSVA